MTPVIFRKDRKKDGGEVFALFPTFPADSYGRCCTSYQHVGQHGGADYSLCIANSTPATSEEGADLYAELVRIGYDDLRVYQREAPWMRQERQAAS